MRVTEAAPELWRAYFDKRSEGNRDEPKLADPRYNPTKVYDRIENFLNLGGASRLETDDLTPEEARQFLVMMAKLTRQGIVGFEEFEIDGRRERHYVVNQFGDDRLKGARLRYDVR
ncbi:MAG: hypothetical protein GF419_08545 [Ignavibacteriales bacterium]|jgi:hypothetical protein|nr:hypothetical protein [Ignavibacteriales bacterium]